MFLQHRRSFWGLQLLLSAVTIVIGLIRRTTQPMYVFLGFALTLGGAMGNLIDRLVFGHVIEFV
ncbi:hypothetical protein DMX10_18150 [Pseudomonas sp. 57B-090624]|nr:hypothetical protein DMX10_18150 [Pseudomonas sp. 57B-090624]